MTWLWQLRSLYSLDVLDTRFTTSSTSPLKPHDYERRIDPARQSSTDVTENAKEQGTEINGALKRSLWHTQEFYIYYVIFLVAVPLMFKAAIDVSKGCLQNPSLKYGILTTMIKKHILAIRSLHPYSHPDGFLNEK